jgi:hypothetical protein
VHNSTCHNTKEYREIKKLTEQYREQLKQQRGDGAPSRQREGKQKTDLEEDKEDEMWFQKAKRDLKAWRFLGYHVPSHCQEPTPRGGGGRTCPKGGTAPQVDGDVDQFRRF